MAGRFLCRIKEEEILEPLIPSILANLEHRHSYVRRNAVLAINSIYKLPKVRVVPTPRVEQKSSQAHRRWLAGELKAAR